MRSLKKLYLIGGTMGVGKTAVAQRLKARLPNSVFLDGDWCWDASPFQVTDETKDMVMGNICYLLNSFIHCSAYDNIIFCWVMHRQSIIDAILERTDAAECEVKVISLIASEKTLTDRITADVRSGVREIDVLDRSIARIPLYRTLSSIKIGTDGKTADAVADEISAL